MKLRKRRNDRTVSLDEDVETEEGSMPREVADWSPNPEQLYGQSELGDILKKTIQGLPPGFRTVFVLRDVEGLSTELTDKVAIISGSSKGIGLAIAKEFAENNGAIVIVCSRILDQAKKTASLIKGKTFAIQLNVTNDLSIKKLIDQVISIYGQIDILVNNSGYPFDRNIWNKRFHDSTLEDFDKIIEVDLKGSMRLSKAVIPLMLGNINEVKKKKEKGKGGVIINISSTPAIAGYTEGSLYNIAKAAIISLTKCIAKEYAKNNIRAYSLALGNIATTATYNSMNKDEQKIAAQESPMKRWGKPEEVAKVAACIASNGFSFASGNTITLDGGGVLL